MIKVGKVNGVPIIEDVVILENKIRATTNLSQNQMSAVNAAIAGGSFEVRSNGDLIESGFAATVLSDNASDLGISRDQITDLLKNAELSNTEWFKVFDIWNGDNIAPATGGVDASIGVKILPD